MRISPSEAQVIKETASTVFGERASVWLFGSRADDALKCGDIDLYIELPSEDYVYAKKLRFWCELVKRLGDQKIDVVINKIGASPHLPIHDVARTKGIRL
ncbi:MAG: nucleotidyltransferase domain-containing protein [Gallionella sp.]